MTDETKIENMVRTEKTRRAFVTGAAKVAVTAPVVAMLLNASTKPAAAQSLYQPAPEIIEQVG
jgi:hypothetical protein